MRVICCHNHYLNPGGEDQVFEDEVRLLESRGCDVIRYERSSTELSGMGPCTIAAKTLWNGETFDQLRSLIRKTRPDVIHCTNIFPLISPAAYDAARVEGVPVVQSLHNFRTICANGLLMRDGNACEACVGAQFPWQGVASRCYRNSRIASFVSAGSIFSQRLKRDTHDPVSVYVALSEFSRSRFVQAGFEADRIVTKPNFVYPDPGLGNGSEDRAVFVGRLSPEKGIDVLLDAWKRLDLPVTLHVIGDGPLAHLVKEAAATDWRIHWHGWRTIEEVYRIVGDSACLVLPSRCYENCPKTILEAYAKGTPAIVSGMGSMQELVTHGETGLHFRPADADSLAEAVTQFMSDRTARAQMRRWSRRKFEQEFTDDVHFQRMIEIYSQAVGTAVAAVATKPAGIPRATTPMPIAMDTNQDGPIPTTGPIPPTT